MSTGHPDRGKVDFRPISAALVPACREFNERLRQRTEPPFLLPEEAPAEQPHSTARHYAAVDSEGAVRGGVLLVEHRGWLDGRAVPVLNMQSPLSEGIVDRAFSGVGLQMLQFVLQKNPFCYAVGMGSEQNPFARLLMAAGWQVKKIPFQFSVIHAGRFLREAGVFRHGNKKLLAQIAAATGVGALAAGAWRAAHHTRPAGGYSLEATPAVWPAEVDAIWERCRGEFAFSVMRDACELAGLHPDGQPRLQRYLLRSSGGIAGWSAARITRMQGSPHFGNMTVGSILDAMAPPEHLGALLAKTQEALCDLGADLIVANCTHDPWREQLRALGFLHGPSNYLAGVSRPIAKALAAPAGMARAYVSRADGDGRLNL